MRHNREFYKALDFAITTHQGQDRGPFKNYVIHPVEVVNILEEVCGEEIPDSVYIAAILHDAIEDGNLTFDDIQRKFGTGVAQVVAQVTDDPRLPRWQQKEEQIAKVATMDHAGLVIKFADRLANVAGECGKTTGSEYLAHTRKMIDAFEERLQALDPFKRIHFRLTAKLVGLILEAITPQ